MALIAIAAVPDGIRPAGDPNNIEQHTLPAGAAITAGQAVRIDVTTGRFVLALATTAANGRIYGIAMRTVAAGYAVTAIRRGRIAGYTLDSQAYDAALFLSDTAGSLADAAGTVSIPVGRVIPAFTQNLGSNPDKLVEIDIRA